MRPRKTVRVLPGFGLTLGYTLLYLGLVVLMPLGALLAYSLSMSWGDFWATVSAPRVLAAFRLTFGASLAAVLAGNGWVGRWLEPLGLELAFKPAGIVVALIFIGLPFVVRTVQPVLQEAEKELEEAAACLGATRWQTFRHVIFPAIAPALVTGFALAFARAVGEYGSVIFIAGNMPMVSEIAPLIIIGKLEQYDTAGAAAVATVMLLISFAMLLAINALQAWGRRRKGEAA